MLIPIVLEKLSCDIREHLARQHGDDDWLLSDLRYAIFKEIKIKEASVSNMVQPEAELYGSTASLFAGAKCYRGDRNHRDSRQTLKCLLCGDPHVTSECGKNLDDVIRLLETGYDRVSGWRSKINVLSMPYLCKQIS